MAAEERKVVTAVFVDLVDFTERSERLDPEDVRGFLAPYHARAKAELERFGGTVEKFIGDAVVAVFGAPIAHEDDAERAVRAALAVRDAISELNADDPSLGLSVRVGAATGEALVNLNARPEQGEQLAAGDVLNTASRLQSAAPPDGILVDEATRRLTENAIEHREAESVFAKGKADPVTVWEPIAPKARLGVDIAFRGGAPLVGRSDELNALLDAVARSQRDRAPQLVTLVGVPGIGKSRLVWELFSALDSDPAQYVTWRQGRSLPYGDGVAFWALGEMTKAQAGILESDDAEAAEAKLRAAVEYVLDEVGEARWVEGHLRPLAGLGAGAEAGGDHATEALAAWRRFFEALAEQRPLILVFEDLHWADDGLLDFVDQMAEWTTDVPLLILCTARPELLDRKPGWGGGKRNATTISLAPLSQDDTAELVSSLLDGRLQGRASERAPDSRRRESALRGGVRAHARPGRGGAAAPGVRPGHHRGPARHAPARREDPRPGRCDRRQGLLARGARRDARSVPGRRRAGGRTHSNARSSCAGSAARRSPARPRTSSATCSFATSPTARSRASGGRTCTGWRRAGSRRSPATGPKTSRTWWRTTT